jgi:hypothetical protein
MLKTLNVFKLKVPDLYTQEEKELTIETLFPMTNNESLSTQEIVHRRAVVTKIIDEKSATHVRKSFFSNRKMSLLAKESDLEKDYEKQLKEQTLIVSQRKEYVARFSLSSLSTFSCCGPQIVGCYAPDGDHCEKPLEIGLKSNQALLSIFDENIEGKPTEIENAEVLFTDQGMFVFKIYTNGHPYDTSIVWTMFFKALLEAHLVPCVILPQGFPNARTYSLLNQFVTEEYCSSSITFKDDLFEEESYYDFKPVGNF